MAQVTKKTSDLSSIRPAARHILTIGRGLVKDSHSALLELVKNSYDADAEHVTIEFLRVKTGSNWGIRITVQDDGHGMTYETVRDIWMVPSTTDKQEKVRSELKKRPLQGRKGIGRYAAFILGDELLLETTRNEETITAELDWNQFAKKKYLDEIQISLHRQKTSSPSGTLIRITGNKKYLSEWDANQINSFKKELRRLISPMHDKNATPDFSITVKFSGFPDSIEADQEIIIEPFPVLEAFDYRIWGEITATGEASLNFENGVAGTAPQRLTKFHIPLDDGAKFCGKLRVDFKIYDRDPESIAGLLERLKKKQGAAGSDEQLSKTEVRALLSEICGITVYRSGFRIRPHGDPRYDWLQLDKRRVQRPGVRVGSDRVSGYIEIQPEEQSHLEEKANRDGLKENKHFEGLIQIATRILLEAENKRYEFKLKTGKEQSKRDLTDKLDDLFDFSDVTQTIDKKLSERDVPLTDRKKIVNIIDARVQESNRVIEDVKRIIAIYQGQATLGKIIRVVMHEGKGPLSYFQNQVKLMAHWAEKLKSDFSEKLLNQYMDGLETISRQAERLINLFNKINPLAAKRRSSPVRFSVRKSLDEIVSIFVGEFKENHIEVKLTCDKRFRLRGWPEDMAQIFVNLLDNSLYWLTVKKSKDRKISISATEMDGELKITYRDNGQGIKKEYIANELIFEPDFSTKPDGTGLGLAIAGEAAKRNRGTITAVYSPNGALFEVNFPLPEETKS